MKPKRYPYVGNKKEPINLMIDHIQINKALNFIGLDKSHKDFLSADSKEREIQENILEDITSRIEKCESQAQDLHARVGRFSPSEN